MRASIFFAAATALFFSLPPVMAQTGDAGGSKGSGDSGGERAFNGNVFRQDEMNQQLAPEGSSQYQVGLAFLKDKKYRDAISHLTAATSHKPSDAAAWFYLGYAHQELADSLTGSERDDEVDTAMRNYRRALTLDPDIKAAHQFLGLLYLQKNDADAASGQARSLARICPNGCDERADLDGAIAKFTPSAKP